MPDYYVATTGNDTTGDGSSGNPYASPGKAMSVAVAGAAGWTIHVRPGVYAIGTGAANTAGNKIDFNQGGSAGSPNRMVSWPVSGDPDTDRSSATRFILRAAAGFTGTLITFNNAHSYNQMSGFEVDFATNGVTSASALVMNGRSNQAWNYAVNAGSAGGGDLVSVNQNGEIFDFAILGGATGGFAALGLGAGARANYGTIKGNAGRGVQLNGFYGTLVDINSMDHTGGNGFRFYIGSASAVTLIGGIIRNNAQSNIAFYDTDSSLTCFNTVSTNSGGYSYDNGSGAGRIGLVHSATRAQPRGTTPSYRHSTSVRRRPAATRSRMQLATITHSTP